MRGLVVFADVVADGLFQGRHAVEGAAADAFAGNLGEPTLDLIEPGSAGRREVEMEAWMLLEPFLDSGMFVRATLSPQLL